MWFAEPHPFPEGGSPTRLNASGQQSYEGWSCRVPTLGSPHAAAPVALQNLDCIKDVINLNLLRPGQLLELKTPALLKG